jgi:hypothetical protein
MHKAIKVLKIFKDTRLSLLAIIITLNLENKIIPMDFILARGVLTFWADTGYFVAYHPNLGLHVPGSYTCRIDDARLFYNLRRTKFLQMSTHVQHLNGTQPPNSRSTITANQDPVFLVFASIRSRSAFKLLSNCFQIALFSSF